MNFCMYLQATLTNFRASYNKRFPMKKIHVVVLLLLFSGCEKEPTELLVGSWSRNDKAVDYIITFLEDGTYYWNIPIPGLDPNTGMGKYSVKADALVMIESGWFGQATYKYFYEVDRESLWLSDQETGLEWTYNRNRKHWF